MDDFLSLFTDPESKGLVYIKPGVETTDEKLVFTAKLVPYIKGLALNGDREYWFTPAFRTTNENKNESKEGVLGTNFLWAEHDNTRDLPVVPFPPTMIVDSGHGYHMYWQLSETLRVRGEIESLNKILYEATTQGSGESIANCNRILRVPGTTNRKNEYKPALAGGDPVPVELVSHEPSVVYESRDFHVLGQLSTQVRDLIMSGDASEFPSRSERDFHVIAHMLAKQASDRLVVMIFDHMPVGDKYKEDGDRYLERTIEQVKQSDMLRGLVTTDEVVIIQEGGERRVRGRIGLYENPETRVYMYGTERTEKTVSTFVLEPVVILKDKVVLDLDPSRRKAPRQEDHLVANVVSLVAEPYQIEFPKSAFDSVKALNRCLIDVDWTWLGTETQVRPLLPLLMQQARQLEVPEIISTRVQGLHNLSDQWYFVTDNGVLTESEYFTEYESNIVWVSTNNSYPRMSIVPGVTPKQLGEIGRLVPLINDPQVMWPMIGWFAASYVKPWLIDQGIRLPILNVSGIRGSGKTTVIERVLMWLFGYDDPKGFKANTTSFSKLSILSSSNAIPVFFNEYRHSTSAALEEELRVAYDSVDDPRGRPDQTTISYLMQAPVVIDGEDSLARDAAIRQRIMLVQTDDVSIVEGSPAQQAYKEFRARRDDFRGFAGHYIQRCLKLLGSGEMETVLQAAREAQVQAFPMELPDRTRDNQVATLFGIYLFADTVGLDRPDASVLQGVLESVYDLEHGRDKEPVDEFIEDVMSILTDVNKKTAIKHHYDAESKVMYFTFKAAYRWWIGANRRAGVEVLTRESIYSQFGKADYRLEMQLINNDFMEGVDLAVANGMGLMVPPEIVTRFPSPRSVTDSSHNGQTASAVVEPEKEIAND